MGKINGEPTTIEVLESVHEVLDVLNTFSTHVDKRFEKIESEITSMKSEITSIKSVMVTKDELKHELAKAIEPLATKKDLEDMRGDIVMLIRKEDDKVVAVVDCLKQQQVISGSDANRILSMQPFPSA
ncbi:hypothetical protein HY734_02310 [Candidatus Uhrbacteria bacterium]|nr:hypothetical protein [Candidatus Uhrbacteria bacterium]